ncbi:hypothetical protein [Sporosarcina luteola]|uniref:hypothetical protein n=1 Tax=Sporosarcina luteola TaxID=582850 RepID=UPI002041DE8E|nr:hypothetical protein [Sporosarcina luteola]MCM3711851.1 hypothetical protein [Sporosarcina luteola]
MDQVKLYLKYRIKSYLLYTAIFISGFIIAMFIFGPPKHYVVPTLSMITAYGSLEYVGFRRWQKDKKGVFY